MYLGHFGLREPPFLNTPDPRFVYLSARHDNALAYLLDGVQQPGAFVHLTGETGNGKTAVCRLLLHRLPAGVDVALIVKPVLTPEELLITVCHELRVQCEDDAPTRTMLVAALERHLLTAHARDRRTVLIVDDAQDVGVGALEQLRALADLGTESQKLLQVILVGQPELSQRITSGHHLLPLTEPETCAYVRHRLAVAGATREIFQSGALQGVHRLSGGVPRVINLICDRALLGAHGQRLAKVDEPTVRAAGREVLAGPGSQAPESAEEDRWAAAAAVATMPLHPMPAARSLWPWLVGGVLVMSALGLGAVFVINRPPGSTVLTPAPPAAQKAAARAKPEASRVPVPAVQVPTVQSAPLAIPQPIAPAPPTPAGQAQPIVPAPAITPARPAASGLTSVQRRRLRPPPVELAPDTAPVHPDDLPAQPDDSPAQLDDSRESPLKIDLLVWAADPKARMVYLNGRRYVEGEALASGAVIEQIAENSIVLAHEGRRIRLQPESR